MVLQVNRPQRSVSAFAADAFSAEPTAGRAVGEQRVIVDRMVAAVHAAEPVPR